MTRAMNSKNSRLALRVPYMAFNICQTTPGSYSPRGGITTMGSSTGRSACQKALTMSYSPSRRDKSMEPVFRRVAALLICVGIIAVMIVELHRDASTPDDHLAILDAFSVQVHAADAVALRPAGRHTLSQSTLLHVATFLGTPGDDQIWV